MTMIMIMITIKIKIIKKNNNAQTQLNVYQIHYDQIYELPNNATILASSKKCPVEIFEIENIVLGVQGHPEFGKEYMKGEINACRNSETEKTCEIALQEISQNNQHSELLQSFMRQWLKN